jgi:hypothetical protein
VSPTSRDQVDTWIDGYERAWRLPGTDALSGLFTADASYSTGPYEETRAGLSAIAELWEAERDGPEEAFTMSSEIVALEGDTAVARIEVAYGDPEREYRDLWLMSFAEDGRCRAFEEWPFWPGREVVSPG